MTSFDIDDPIITIENEHGNDLNYGIGYFIDDDENNKSFSLVVNILEMIFDFLMMILVCSEIIS